MNAVEYYRYITMNTVYNNKRILGSFDIESFWSTHNIIKSLPGNKINSFFYVFFFCFVRVVLCSRFVFRFFFPFTFDSIKKEVYQSIFSAPPIIGGNPMSWIHSKNTKKKRDIIWNSVWIRDNVVYFKSSSGDRTLMNRKKKQSGFLVSKRREIVFKFNYIKKNFSLKKKITKKNFKT